jgi:hypothetical protein
LNNSDTPAGGAGARAHDASAGLFGRIESGLSRLRRHPVMAWLVPAGSFLFVALVGLTNEPLYERLIHEDGPIEVATLLLAICTAVVAGVVAYELAKSDEPKWLAVCWAAFAIGSLILAGEELSWGQRQFGFAGPDALVARNVQDEANVHNLLTPWALSAAYTAVGVYGAGVGHALWRRVPRVGQFADFLAPPWQSLAAIWFAVHALVYGWYSVIEPLVRAVGVDFALDDHLRKLGEPSEMILGVGLLLFAVESFLRIRLRSEGFDRGSPAGLGRTRSAG